MARRKKTTAAPQADKEELLKKALVPEDEQPYKVPSNWCWVRTNILTELHRGVAYAKTDVSSTKGADDCLILRGGNILEGAIQTLREDNVYINKHLVRENQFIQMFDTIIVASTASDKVIGRAGIVANDFSDVAFGAFLLLARPKQRYIKKFVSLYFQTSLYRKTIKESVAGTNIYNIRLEYISELPFPIPPLPEQQRIVERIESLFSKLDAAKERIQNALDGCELRKAAILKKAFNGELTEKWRKEHGEDLKSWSDRTLKECGTWHGGGTPSTSHPEYWENGKILWITSKDMKSDLIEDTIKHINMLGIENSAVKYNTQPSVLFVTRSGILRRTLPISMVKKPFTVNQDLKVLTPSDINLEYLFWACKDNEHKMLEKCMKTGITVENINTDKLMEYTIPIAPILEQLEIVQIINNLLEKESKVKEAAEQALRQIEYIKKSILAKAFRGELGTNDPQEESSLELLKQIIETGNS